MTCWGQGIVPHYTVDNPPPVVHYTVNNCEPKEEHGLIHDIIWVLLHTGRSVLIGIAILIAIAFVGFSFGVGFAVAGWITEDS